MSITVKWSPDLKRLADDLLDSWETVRQNADPFAKTCIVVNDPFTEKWLKRYFLVDKKIPQIMMDLEFVRLPEFVNDWLWATVHETSPRERQASSHSYSKNVLAWRIYRILEKAAPEGALKELLNYTRSSGGKDSEKRYALAVKLASLYDDYLNSRFRMLLEWEEGASGTPSHLTVPEWQVVLYQELVQENPGTYAREYETALNEETDAAKAFVYGFPKYLAVYVFDVPFISEPTLRLMEKMSEAMPMTFWNFNPMDEWLAETPSRKEVRRELRKGIQKSLRQHREALGNARNPADVPLDIRAFYDSAKERLLGAMASGARGVLGALCDDCEGDVDSPTGGRSPLEEFGSVRISIHSTYSPRRELEAVKDGLHDFLKENAPHEALVLCADWETYAPIIDAVFSPTPETEGYIPIMTEGMPGSTPLMQSFEKLLEFRKNRFEVSAVFALLDVPAIREKHGLDEDSVDALRDMVRKANIHWGLDDDDVAQVLGLNESKETYPFTWRRGLDRLTAELLYGFPENDELLLTVGKMPGRLHPCGHVEGERAKKVAALWTLVGNLEKLRKELPRGRKTTPEMMREHFVDIIGTFYLEKEDNSFELNKMLNAIRTVAETMQTAGLTDSEIEVEVFIQAVQDALRNQMPGRRSSADSVLFAPLNAYTATPHKFVWICGLNDGAFPRMDRRASFDAIGRHPSLFDATSREKDAFALLKAALCAEGRLSFSYVGKAMRTNEDIPPSVLLTNLSDYFKANEINVSVYSHPLQGFSQRYFQEVPTMEGQLPPNYSRTFREMAENLSKPRQRTSSLVAFPIQEDGVTEISLDELVAFFSHPNRFLIEERLNGKIQWTDNLNDEECLETRLDKALKRKLALEDDSERPSVELVVEKGNSSDERTAEIAIELASQRHGRVIEFVKSRKTVYACHGDGGELLNLAMTYKVFLERPTEDMRLELSISGRPFRLTGSYRTLTLQTLDGDVPHAFLFMDYLKSTSGNSRNLESEIAIRHLAVNVAQGGGVATIAFGPEDKVGYLPLNDMEEAKAKLSSLLELVTGPVPEGYPDFGKVAPKDDKVPEEWLALLDGMEII